MNEEAFGIDVCLDVETIKSAPHCAHGPTLLFERFVKGKKSSKCYYACSATRDRKLCGFYRLVDDKHVGQKSKIDIKEDDRTSFPYSHDECTERLKKMRSLKSRDRHLCRTCGLLLISDEIDDHRGHQIQTAIEDCQLQTPTTLLEPLINNQTNAQFLFTDKTVKFLKDLIQRMQFKRVLCIGTPRLFESILQDHRSQIIPKCLLLDIDRRFEQFYDGQQFCRYNMFNHHFFGGPDSYNVYIRFLQDPLFSPDDLLIVMDPPFGGLVQLIALTLKRINQEVSNVQSRDSERIPNTVWLFPYYMETRILKALPTFSMLDYKVEYKNSVHLRRKEDKNAATVRVFTNLDPSTVVLPSNEGYSFCSKCKRYVNAENKHCTNCDSCTTKVGSTYRHCSVCNRCVKPSWQHCERCNSCEIPGQHSQNVILQGCHICDSMDHKRWDCPSRQTDPVRAQSDRKRKGEKNDSKDIKQTQTNRPKRRK